MCSTRLQAQVSATVRFINRRVQLRNAGSNDKGCSGLDSRPCLRSSVLLDRTFMNGKGKLQAGRYCQKSSYGGFVLFHRSTVRKMTAPFGCSVIDFSWPDQLPDPTPEPCSDRSGPNGRGTGYYPDRRRQRQAQRQPHHKGESESKKSINFMLKFLITVSQSDLEDDTRLDPCGHHAWQRLLGRPSNIDGSQGGF